MKPISLPEPGTVTGDEVDHVTVKQDLSNRARALTLDTQASSDSDETKVCEDFIAYADQNETSSARQVLIDSSNFIGPNREKSSSSPFPDTPRIERRLSLPCNIGANIQPVESPRTKPHRRRSSVSFDTVSVREYDQTIGDHPSCSYGPPISLDWTYTNIGTVPLEKFENRRSSERRKKYQLTLSYYTRKNVLTRVYGHTDKNLEAATKEANKIKVRRAMTRGLLPVSKLEEVAESAARKATRAKRTILRRASP